jgi:polysaccharide deacetylase family protein (PEP-CTERM system associated)
MTIDVEDWYHCIDHDPANWSRYEDRIVDPVRRLLEIFDTTDTLATFFVLGHVADAFPNLIREIHDQGHEIATHGSEHRFVYGQTPEEFEADVSRSMSRLYEITGVRVRGYRAPFFSITRRSLWALPVLKKLRIEYDSSIFPVLNHRYGIPDAPRLPHQTENGLTEIPVSTFPIGRTNVPCGGGVYFRALPLSITMRCYERLARRNEPIVFYLHPWEIDADHPRIPMPATLRVRHYWGLAKTAAKLTRLCSEFPFTSVQHASL